MPSTPRRKPVKSHRASSLGLAAPLQLALFAGACLQAPADSDSDGASTGSSSGDVSSTQSPTTGSDDTGPPALAEGRYFLRIDDDPVPPVVLEMDRAKVIEVFGEKALKQIKLLDVDSTPLLLNVLDQIQNACGNMWRLDSKDPLHDCQNPKYFDPDVNDADNVEDIKAKYGQLGKTFGPGWKTSPAFAMVRLLSMTPANANVRGTSLQKTADYIANNPDLPFTFKKVLADSLGIAVTTAFIPNDKLAQALKDTLMSSHPNLGNDEGKLPITLYDAVKDMQPLSQTFGPVDGHPGILVNDDENFTTHSDALTPEFGMRAVAESNLRLVQGVDASVGAGSMFLSLAPAPLNFDFNDEDKVQMYGIAAVPTVDMRMSITELTKRIESCTEVPACFDNAPGMPTGDQYIWSTEQWSLERIIGTAGYYSYRERNYEVCLIKDPPACDAGVWIGEHKIAFPPPGEVGPVGWTQFKVLDKQVPAPQFLWEMLLDIAQVAIHDPVGDDDFAAPTAPQKANNIAEGDAKPVFALKGVPIGLTAEQMIAQIRPNLQAQAEFIAKTILGKFWKHNDHLDFYYRRGSDGGAPILFFVAETDLRPDPSNPEQLAAYTYAKPGFFADAALTTKLSSTTLDGVPEADHEKLALPTGDTTVYMQDDAGDTYALRFYVPPGGDPTEIVVHVRPA